jgi:hypothetical protein
VHPFVGPAGPRRAWWLALSLTVPLVYAAQSLAFVLGRDWIVQDDARQHVFWMWRFVDPALFPGDVIADYFASLAPPGYRALYRILAMAGIDPLLASKVLPAALAVVASAFCHGTTVRLLPVPAAGFLATLVLNQSLWIEDDLASATPRAFACPLFLAFLYHLLGGRALPCAVTVGLLGLFYPQVALVAQAILSLRLLRWHGRRPAWSPDRGDRRRWVAGALVLIPALALAGLPARAFGPVVTAAQSRAEPEFGVITEGPWPPPRTYTELIAGDPGRAFFFHDNPWIFWLAGPRSGLFPGLLPPLALAGLALPALLRWSRPGARVRQARGALALLGQVVAASLALFALAHLLLFELHLPNRYVYHSLRTAAALGAGIALLGALDAGRRAGAGAGRSRLRATAIVAAAGLVLALALLPFLPRFTIANQLHVTGRAGPLYLFLQGQPADTMVASLSPEANNLPIFARRSILVGSEYALPYHVRYRAQIRARTAALIEAQYSADGREVRGFIERHGVDFWLLDRAAFAPSYPRANALIHQLRMDEAVSDRLRAGRPALAAAVPRCTVLDDARLVLLAAACVRDAMP